MAGASIHVEFDDAEVRRALGRLQAAGTDLRPAMQDIGEHLLNATRGRFHDEEDPEGHPWAPLRPATKKRKKRNAGKILTEEGHLRGIVMQADSDSVVVGSPFIYAGVHQFGAEQGAFGSTSRGSPIPWGDIPARPFLGVPDDDEREIVAIILDHLRDAIR